MNNRFPQTLTVINSLLSCPGARIDYVEPPNIESKPQRSAHSCHNNVIAYSSKDIYTSEKSQESLSYCKSLVHTHSTSNRASGLSPTVGNIHRNSLVMLSAPISRLSCASSRTTISPLAQSSRFSVGFGSASTGPAMVSRWIHQPSSCRKLWTTSTAKASSPKCRS